MSSANEMPKVSDSFFNALSWRSVSAILICFMALVAYTPDIPPSTPYGGPYVAPQDESGVPEPLRGRVLHGECPHHHIYIYAANSLWDTD